MTRMSSILSDRYFNSVDEQKKLNKKYGLKIFTLGAFKDGISSNVLLYFFNLAYLLYETLVAHKLQAGDFIACYNAVNQIVGAIISIITVLRDMQSSAYTIDKYNDLMVPLQNIMHNIKNEGKLEKINTIELKNVSFCYPGTEKYVLRNINLKLNIGEKIAIVGKNGSGKTTLVHLLMGLYTPTCGIILINGRAIEKEEYLLYRQQFAAFFQGMLPFEASISENVALDVEMDNKLVKVALGKVGLEKLRCKELKEMIGIQFDSNGIILSGGEFQKLMLSYCFYSNKMLIIMDEPTSALDPMVEKEFNNRVEEFSDGKLVLFITHRLSTVHMADYIYVIDEGRICECGKHDDLMMDDGIYSKMYKIQAGKY